MFMIKKMSLLLLYVCVCLSGFMGTLVVYGAEESVAVSKLVAGIEKTAEATKAAPPGRFKRAPKAPGMAAKAIQQSATSLVVQAAKDNTSLQLQNSEFPTLPKKPEELAVSSGVSARVQAVAVQQAAAAVITAGSSAILEDALYSAAMQDDEHRYAVEDEFCNIPPLLQRSSDEHSPSAGTAAMLAAANPVHTSTGKDLMAYFRKKQQELDAQEAALVDAKRVAAELKDLRAEMNSKKASMATVEMGSKQQAPEVKAPEEDEDFESVIKQLVAPLASPPFGWKMWSRKAGVTYALVNAETKDPWSLQYLHSLDGRNHTARELNDALKALTAENLTIDNPHLVMIQRILTQNEVHSLGMNPVDIEAAWKNLRATSKEAMRILDTELEEMRNRYSEMMSERFARGATLRQHVSGVQRVAARLLSELNLDKGNASDDEHFYGEGSGPKKWKRSEVFDKLKLKKPKKDAILGVSISLEQLNENVAAKLQ